MSSSDRPGDAFGMGGDGAHDRMTILAGTGQNVIGLGIFVIASFGMNILIAQAFGKGSAAFGQITVATQLAFVVGAATRFGMDMAAVRRVAIEVGKGEGSRVRAVVRIAATIALSVSAIVGLLAFLFAPSIGSLMRASAGAYRAAAVALVFVAIAQVYLGGSRGLKIMRHTLYAYWIGQSISWIAFTLVAWAVSGRTVAVTVSAYAASWVFATAVAWFFWRKESGRFPARLPAEDGEARALIRYGAPRAPAALLSQALFYTDLFVLSIKLPAGDPALSVYAASVRVSQALVLFLTAVSYMFSPFVADLHERGEQERLNDLFKSITRWTLALTVPLLLLFMIAPGPVLRLFGSDYDAGTAWLRILLIGQTVNVSVGAAGFILIMVGRTTWDLTVYASSFLLDLAMALLLVPHLGPKGAAIAQATTLVFSNALRLFLVWRFVRIQPYDRDYARLLIPAAIGAVAMLGVHSVLDGPKWALDLVGTGLVGGLAYYTAFLLFGLTPSEKGAVMRLLRRPSGT
ncbi:MAG: oligosaccharide flippase family protein [Actinomycetota bacterium]